MTRELARRIAFTLGALFVYRLGLHIPLPGIDLRVWDEIFRNQAPGIMGMIGFLPTSHMAIFALGIVPYITAAVLVQLATIVSRRVRALAQQGERGRQTLVRYTRHLTLLLTASQAWAVAGGLEQVADVVTRPGPLFMVSTVITLTGGTMLLVWLAEQITLRGLGNGIALILLASTVTQLPEAIAFTVELGRQRVLSTKLSAALLLLVVAVTAFIVWMELARRRLPIRFPGRQASVGTPDHQPSHLSLKLNPAGVIPVLLASWLIGILLALGTFVAGHDAELWIAIMGQLGHGRLLHLILYAAFILVCTFFYTAFLVDPDGTAEWNLHQWDWEA